MHERLEKYLQEISHYLALERGTEEILAEIKSHILEKAEQESGGVTEESLQRVIAIYGCPQEVAAKYMEGHEIISPTFKRYLFRYTAVLFATHFVLTVVAVHFRTSIIAIPLFMIPKMSVWAAFVYLPMALIYDFGLVAIILYFISQRNMRVRLPWPGVWEGRRGESGLGRPRPALLAVRIVLLFVLLFLLVRYHTIMFYFVNLQSPKSLLSPASSVFFSIMLIAAYACHTIAYGVRFVFNSAWVVLVERILILLILWVLWNSPIKPEYNSFPGIDLRIIGGLLLLLFIAWSVVGLLRSLVQVTREMSLP